MSTAELARAQAAWRAYRTAEAAWVEAETARLVVRKEVGRARTGAKAERMEVATERAGAAKERMKAAERAAWAATPRRGG